ncbi:hypothetical protein [Pyrobaculum arsenaticum]|uniref:Piwi domain-containing protein n=3 Tax=Pyrobaculum arsenaticum TaxID=121277 RepID=A4WLC2_PYRAR|nr:hypothetical protein [Pyrobaculum arsenaticum]ABP51189.1 hypothetical protein Pars_1636 [Pyrobaculum arsenaticum DSM 13514]NYR15086.1 hypothetical protein [Pyrobaculum arsenaticum]
MSYRSDGSHYGPSYLQLVDGTKLMKTLEYWKRYGPEKGQIYAKSYFANFLSSIYYKGGCIPFHVKLPDENLNAVLQNSLIIGIGTKRTGNSIYKGVAIVMTGYGNVVALISKDFRLLEGKSYEFNEEEIKKFREEIKRHIDAYIKGLGTPPELVIVIRSRMFLGKEVETLLSADSENDEFERRLATKLTSKFWWRRYFKRVLVMSVYKTKYSFDKDVAILASHRDEKQGISGVWFMQLRKQKYATQIVWYYTEKDAKLPLAAYLYIRALDFTSLHESRIIPFPIRVARRYLRWVIARGAPAPST